jgi:hypothetical protein
VAPTSALAPQLAQFVYGMRGYLVPLTPSTKYVVSPKHAVGTPRCSL